MKTLVFCIVCVLFIQPALAQSRGTGAERLEGVGWEAMPDVVPAELDNFGPTLPFVGWFNIPGATFGGGAVVSDSVGNFYLVVRGTDDQVYVRRITAAGVLDPWVSLFGRTFYDPGIGFNPISQEIVVVVTGIDQVIYYNALDLVTGVWSGWHPLAAGATDAAPTIAFDQRGNALVIVRDVVSTLIWANKSAQATPGDPCITKTVAVMDNQSPPADQADWTITNNCDGTLSIRIVPDPFNPDEFFVCAPTLAIVQGGQTFTWPGDYSWDDPGGADSICIDLPVGSMNDSTLTETASTTLDLTQAFSMFYAGLLIATFP